MRKQLDFAARPAPGNIGKSKQFPDRWSNVRPFSSLVRSAILPSCRCPMAFQSLEEFPVREQIEQWIAWHLPENIARWCWIRVTRDPAFRRQTAQDALLAFPGSAAPLDARDEQATQAAPQPDTVFG